MCYIVYSIFVFTYGTNTSIKYNPTEQVQIAYGKKLFQQHNCIACHQVYGLGGYLGSDLTIAYSDSKRGEVYIKTVLKNGSVVMPKFNFSEKEINAITFYLKYVDSTAVTYKH